MDRSSIYHISEHNYAYATANDTLAVRVRTRKDDVKRILVHYKNLYDHSERISTTEMKKILTDGICDMYEASLVVEEKRFKYYFELFDVVDHIFLTSDGLLDNFESGSFFYYPYINDDDIFDLPAWAEGEIIYQIFVDRFFDGDPSNNPEGTRSWNVLPDKTIESHGGFKGELRRNTYYGGDIEGVIKKLDYIRGLGAKIIYLTPIFKSDSYHKYDINDYFEIDRAFGDKAKAKEMVDEAHRLGLKVLLDGVFNHCGYANRLFMDVIENQSQSKYKDWFCIRSFPVNENRKDYDSFGNVAPSMPRLNTSNPEVIRYVIDVAKYWTEELGVDGWRMDVADEVSHRLWVEFRSKMKRKWPEMLLIGEIWNHASRWLQGSEMDTVTNYKFMRTLHLFSQRTIGSHEFWNRTGANMMLYKTLVNNYLVNLVGSHDTKRCRTTLGSERRHVLAVLVTLAFQGMPLIYYGDELCMEGADDPDNRRPMEWGALETNCALTIREFSRFRSRSEVLKKGKMVPLNTNQERVLAFIREFDGKKLLFAANFGDSPATFSLEGYICRLVLGNAIVDGAKMKIGREDYALLEIDGEFTRSQDI